MNVSEAQWLRSRLQQISDSSLFPLLDVGSSTSEFRERVQPHIDSEIFAPLRARSGRVYHLDQKKAEGVDLVGDLADPTMFDEVLRLDIRSALVSNVLEHVVSPVSLCRSLLELIPPGGYLFVSGPYSYPYHADPIDTMFRPTIDELHACFPGTELIDGAIISAGNWTRWNASERGRSLPRTLARMMTPFYRPQQWLDVIKQAPFLVRDISAVAVVLRRLEDRAVVGTPETSASLGAGSLAAANAGHA